MKKIKEELKCVCCGKEYPAQSVGFMTRTGFLCMACECEELEVSKVTHINYGGWVVFVDDVAANEFIDLELHEGDENEKRENYVIQKEKMKALEFLNLKEWDGW